MIVMAQLWLFLDLDVSYLASGLVCSSIVYDASEWKDVLSDLAVMLVSSRFPADVARRS